VPEDLPTLLPIGLDVAETGLVMEQEEIIIDSSVIESRFFISCCFELITIVKKKPHLLQQGLILIPLA
jgi:hypothetical protein